MKFSIESATSAVAILALAVLTVSTAQAQLRPRSPDETAIAKAIKRAERAGFERYDLKAWQSVFEKDAVWTIGRTEAVGPHEHALTFDQQEAILKVRLSRPRAGSETLYFNAESFELKGGAGTYTTIIERHFFGGMDVFQHRYSMKKSGPNWRVVAVRSWPVRHEIGGESQAYNKESLAELDAAVDSAKPEHFSLRFGALVNARRYQEAYELAKAKLTEAPKNTEALTALSFVAFDLGFVDEARVAATALLALNPSASTPFPIDKKRKSGKK